jgi:hypothetical protein
MPGAARSATCKSCNQPTKTNNLMKKTAIILATLGSGVATALAGPAPAPVVDKSPPPPPRLDPCAGPISYNNIELLYQNTDFGFNDDQDGVVLRAEYSPMQNFYLTGSVGWGDGELGDIWSFSVGLGGYFPLTENIHIAADAGYMYTTFDTLVQTALNPPTFIEDSDSEDGWYVRPHLRAKWGCFTAKAGALYMNVDHDETTVLVPGGGAITSGGDDDTWAWFIQLYYQLTPNWDITAGYTDGEDDFEQWIAGVRFRY